MTINQEHEDAASSQGFADLREGRHRRITPEVLQQEQGAASSEMAWDYWPEKGLNRAPSGGGWYVNLAVQTPEGVTQDIQMPEWLADRIIADHELTAWAIRAREVLEQTREEDRPLYRTVNELLGDYPGSAAVEGMSNGS